MALMTRREFNLSSLALPGLLYGCKSESATRSPLSASLSPRDAAGAGGLPPPPANTHVVNRLGFGVNETTLRHVNEIGLEAWIAEQLSPDTLDDSRLEAEVAARFPTTVMPRSTLFEQKKGLVMRELQAATLYRAANSPRQLFEVMVDFWTNHFNIYQPDGILGILKTLDDREVIRPHAMTTFGEILHASAKSPAMLVYLDNVSNTRKGGNENYARELMELHTLGVDGGYDQTDVEQVALCFTGWTVTRKRSGDPGRFTFNARLHAPGEKTVLGETIHFPDDPVREGERVLDLLAGHPSTAHFVSKKLCRRFVADQPSAALVERVAARFANSGGDIPATLGEIFASREFLDSADQKIRRPIDHVVAALRVSAIDPGEREWRAIGKGLQALGQPPFGQPSPDGYPDVADAWINTNALITRWNLAATIALFARKAGLFDNLPDNATATTLVDHLTDRILFRRLEPDDRTAMIAFAAQDRAVDEPIRARRLPRIAAGVAALMLASPYFQWQ